MMLELLPERFRATIADARKHGVSGMKLRFFLEVLMPLVGVAGIYGIYSAPSSEANNQASRLLFVSMGAKLLLRPLLVSLEKVLMRLLPDEHLHNVPGVLAFASKLGVSGVITLLSSAESLASHVPEAIESVHPAEGKIQMLLDHEAYVDQQCFRRG